MGFHFLIKIVLSLASELSEALSWCVLCCGCWKWWWWLFCFTEKSFASESCNHCAMNFHFTDTSVTLVFLCFKRYKVGRIEQLETSQQAKARGAASVRWSSLAFSFYNLFQFWPSDVFCFMIHWGVYSDPMTV